MIGSLVMVAAFVAVPLVSHAATYAYVDRSGDVSYVEAGSPAEALAKATNMATHSGVMLMTNSSAVSSDAPQVAGDTSIAGYLYVNESGQVVFVDVNSAAAASFNSVNMSTHSGVMIINSTSDQNMVGDTVGGV